MGARAIQQYDALERLKPAQDPVAGKQAMLDFKRAQIDPLAELAQDPKTVLQEADDLYQRGELKAWDDFQARLIDQLRGPLLQEAAIVEAWANKQPNPGPINYELGGAKGEIRAGALVAGGKTLARVKRKFAYPT
jgi:hypothetical protein